MTMKGRQVVKRIEVDFNMADRGCFLVPTDEDLRLGDHFVAFDVEGHELLAVVVALDEGVLYFSEVEVPTLSVTDRSAGSGWGQIGSHSWTIEAGSSSGVTFIGNATRPSVDA